MNIERHRQVATGEFRRAFTLIEVLVVAAVIGMIMAAGAPTLYRALKKEGFRKTVSDIVEVCQAARAQAIMRGEPTAVQFLPHEGLCQIIGGNGSTRGGLAQSARIENARIEMLDVNLVEYKDAEVVRVNFYPNGTCDEMTLILVSDRNEWRKISLEVTTSIVSVDADPNNWR
jgi:prepilin-type N-terminal cleavage/methylation domain-containing protein